MADTPAGRRLQTASGRQAKEDGKGAARVQFGHWLRRGMQALEDVVVAGGLVLLVVFVAQAGLLKAPVTEVSHTSVRQSQVETSGTQALQRHVQRHLVRRTPASAARKAG
ncbi:MAG: hypothetical protein AB7P76_02745 [Candidatus Melainabacteria bacterium]